MKKKEVFKIVVVVFLILVFILSYTVFFFPFSSAPQPTPESDFQGPESSQKNFEGPTGPPNVKGPTEAPPQN
jgi:flagellar basal body-associated protein FliL